MWGGGGAQTKIKHLDYQRENSGKGRQQKTRLPTTLSQQLQQDGEGAATGLLMFPEHCSGPRLTAHQCLRVYRQEWWHRTQA